MNGRISDFFILTNKIEWVDQKNLLYVWNEKCCAAIRIQRCNAGRASCFDKCQIIIWLRAPGLRFPGLCPERTRCMQVEHVARCPDFGQAGPDTVVEPSQIECFPFGFGRAGAIRSTYGGRVFLLHGVDRKVASVRCDPMRKVWRVLLNGWQFDWAFVQKNCEWRKKRCHPLRSTPSLPGSVCDSKDGQFPLK